MVLDQGPIGDTSTYLIPLLLKSHVPSAIHSINADRRRSAMKNLYVSRINIIAGLLLIIGVLAGGNGYAQLQPGQKRTVGDGQELSTKGVIIHRDPDSITLRDLSRNDTTVMLTDSTKVATERKWLFMGKRPFDVTVLVPGLIVTAKGK